MGVNTERLVVEKMYPNKTWVDRVRRMPDHQVLAIYFKNKMQENREKQEPEYKQGTLF